MINYMRATGTVASPNVAAVRAFIAMMKALILFFLWACFGVS